jgi:membrane protein YdbS with pleckstrin-like domain
MSGEKKSVVRNPFAWIFHASVLLLGAVIALNIALAFLRPILPWLIDGAALAAIAWIAIAIVRWRRSRW